MKRRRLIANGMLFLVGLLLGRVALASESDRCIEAHRLVQIDRREHRLINARENTLVCSREACPLLIGKDCRAWVAEMEGAIPSVVLDARDEKGQQVDGVRVVIDGTRVVPRLDGHALELDPGTHTFRFEATNVEPREIRAVVLEGGHAQRVSALLIRSDVPEPKASEGNVTSSRRVPALAIGFGVASLVGIGLATGFGISGLSSRSDLEDSGCRPRCAPGDVASIDRRFLIADVSLAVGVTSAVLAFVFFVTQDRAPVSTRAASVPLGIAF